MRTLYAERLKRPRPATDTKVLTSWNGLAISAFAIGGAVLEDEELLEKARGAAEFILKSNLNDGRLLRRFAGGEAALEGTLEDYAFFIQGLLDLFEATPEPRWLEEALRLAEIMNADFMDKEKGGYFLTREADPVRMKESYDGPTPSGNSVAALDLVRLSELTGEERFRTAAERTIRCFATSVEDQPAAHTTMLTALDLLLNGVREVVVTAATKKGAQGLREEVLRRFIPDKVILVATAATYPELAGMTTLLEGRKPGSRARAFVCQNFVCKLPADSVEALRDQLEPTEG